MTRRHLTHLCLFAIRAAFVGLFFAVLSPAQEAREGYLKKCWAYESIGVIGKTLASDSRMIFFASEDGSVHGIDAATGRSMWNAELGGEIASNIVLSENAVFLVSNPKRDSGDGPNGSRLRSVSKMTGVTNWTVSIPFSDEYYLNRTNSHLVAAADNRVLTISEENGATAWSKTLPGTIATRPAIANGKIALGVDDRKLLIISTMDGRALMDRTLDSEVSVVAFANGQNVVVGDVRGRATLINLETGGTIWKFKSGAGIAHAANPRHGILIHSLDNFVYLISNYNGNVVWKRRLPGRLASGVLLGDELVLAMLHGNKTAYLIDLESGRIVDLVSIADEGFPTQIPVAVGGSQVVFVTPRGVESYAINICSANKKAAQ